MTTFTIDDQHMKDLIKQALLELFQERRDLFADLLYELIEDVGLANALLESQRYLPLFPIVHFYKDRPEERERAK